MDDVLLMVRNLKKHFPLGRGLFQTTRKVLAVDGVSFTIAPGETLGLVGESGCGKSTTGRTILRLIEPTAGDVLFAGQSLLTLHGQALRTLRKEMQIIFQDPYASLNPRKTVQQMLGEVMAVHQLSPGAQRRILLEGDPPSPINPPSGCHFHPRCPKRLPECSQIVPQLLPVAGHAHHLVACHLVHQHGVQPSQPGGTHA